MGQNYMQISRTAMGTPFPPENANIYMEKPRSGKEKRADGLYSLQL